jgi:hypothetical protein
MLTEIETKRRQGVILNIEDSDEEVDWIAVVIMSAALLQEIPSGLPVIVEAFLTQHTMRQSDPWFARSQRLELLSYLRY